MDGSINFSGTLAGSVAGEGGGSNVVIVPTLYDGVKIADYSIDSVGGELYAPEPTEVTITPTLQEGVKVADYSIDGVSGEIRVPEATDVSITPTLQEGVKVADYSIDGVSGEIRVPEATDISITPTLQEGVKVADYSIDGVGGAIYTPAIDWSGLRLTKAIQGLPAAVATITDAEAYDMQALTFGIDTWQEGSGDPSPTNIRPFHGWDSVKVSVFAINIWDEVWEHGSISDVTGEPVAQAGSIRSKNFIPCKPNTEYYCKIITNAVLVIDWYDVNKIFIRAVAATNTTKVSPANAFYFKIRTTNNYGSAYNHDISINYPSSNTGYHEYIGHRYIIHLNEICYGGRFEIVNGLTRYIANKGYIASYNGEVLPGDWLSDRDVYSAGATPTVGAEVVYTLASPVIIPLANINITTIKGVNDIFANSGNIISGEYVSNQRVINIIV